MATILIRVLMGLLCLVALLLVLGVVGRLLPASPAQSTALAALEAAASAPPPGSNGWSQLRLLPYEVPDALRQELLAEDVRALEAFRDQPAPLPPAGDAMREVRVKQPPASPAEGRFPRYQAPGGLSQRLACEEPGDCLDHVRSELEGLRGELGDTAALLARFDEVSNAGHVRSPVDLGVYQGFVLGQAGMMHRPALAARALEFFDDPQRAMAGVCRMHAATRRFAEHGEQLIDATAFARRASASGRMLAEMLAVLEPEEAVPADCEEALAPPGPDHVGLCQAFAGEFRLTQQLTQSMNTGSMVTLVHSGALDARWSAERLAWSCTESGRQRLREDRLLTADELPTATPGWLQCFSAPATCILSGMVAKGSYLSYYNRHLDHLAEQRLLAILAALRPRIAAGEPVEAALQGVTARWPGRPLRLVDDGQWLEMDRFETRRQAVARIPLPMGPAPDG